MTPRTKTFCKSISLLLGLTMIAALVACGGGSSSTTTPPPPTPVIAITATSGTPQSATVGAAFSAPLVATVTSSGSPASGVTVTFTAPSSGASGTFASNSTATETDTTNSSGVATSSVFTAGTTAGAYSVTASATGATTPASFSLSNTAGAPATITATSGTPQTTTVSTPFTSPLVATVADSDGNPISGAVVTFAAPASGASGIFTTSETATEMDTTDSTGVATSSTFTANATAGSSYDVTASVSGVTTKADFVLTNAAVAPVVLITATGGTPQTAAVSTAFSSKLQATVTTNGTPTSGVTVTFTAPASGAGGTFANGTATTNATTNGSGVAKSSTFTANSTAGSYTVTATAPGATAPANFSLTNSAAPTLAAGNYVFSLAGVDANGFYSVAGTITVSSSSAITTGEQDFTDTLNVETDQISGGMITANGSGNLVITITTCDATNCTATDPNVGVAGVETLDATLVSSSKALIIEYDKSGSSSGELNLQPSVPAAPSGGYAFFATGVNSGGVEPLALGGVLNVDGSGTISGTGSVFDLNNSGTTLFPDESFQASTVTGPDTFGRVIFSLAPSTASGVGTIKLAGYMIDATDIRLVEGSDHLGATLGGTAFGQGTNTGAFSSASIAGDSYVFGAVGGDVNGNLQAAGILTAASSGTGVSGNLAYNDITTLSPQGGSTITAGTFAVDPTGRVTLTGVTDAAADFTYNLQLYLSGNGKALLISMDQAPAANVLAGLAYQQSASTFTADSFSGNYALNTGQVTSATKLLGEQNGTGTVAADGVGTLTGTNDFDVNESGKPTTGLSFSGTFATTSTNGVFTGSITDPVSAKADTFTYYMISPSSVIDIENDTTQLTLGNFELQ